MLIGGLVDYNINKVEEKYRWKNTCAVRMSYIINYSGMKIPAVAGKTVTGADGNNYFFRILDLYNFLKDNLGTPKSYKGASLSALDLKNKKGIILFIVSNQVDARRHITLFDGETCYDKCYFHDPLSNRIVDYVYFWELE